MDEGVNKNIDTTFSARPRCFVKFSLYLDAFFFLAFLFCFVMSVRVQCEVFRVHFRNGSYYVLCVTPDWPLPAAVRLHNKKC